MNKIYFTTLGCPRNQVDSEIMIAKLLDKGFSIVNDIEKADIFVVNTCAFLKSSRDEAFEILDEIDANRKKDSKVIVTGCLANLFSDELLKRNSCFSILASGNSDKIVDAIEKPLILLDKKSYLPEKEFTRVLLNHPHLAYLKIAEGCQKQCTFCIIPKIKGKLISRSKESILQEFETLLENGVFEINLIAQDLMDFGKDKNKKSGFVDLLKSILKNKKDFWLRLMYVYPDEITDELIDLMASDKRICKYLDIPLQHISDNILKKMGRKTSKKKIYNIFTKLKEKMPDISLRVSFMVGFPSEKQSDFQMLMDFIEDFEIAHLAVFKYSNEPFCAAYNMKGQLSEKVKQKRFEALSKKQFSLVQKRNKKLIGKIFDALIDCYNPECKFLINARHFGQAFDVDSNIIINDIEKIKNFGKVQKIKITSISGYDLVGKPV